MSGLDLVLLIWAIIITMWLFFVKQGPQGTRGPKGNQREKGETGDKSWWDTRQEINEALDNPEYVQKLITTINKYQIHGGTKIGEKDE